MENTHVGNEHVELPLNAQNPVTVAEELKPVGLTKEALSVHTQKEEQNYVDRFRRRILLSPFRTCLQWDSRSNNEHSYDQGRRCFWEIQIYWAYFKSLAMKTCSSLCDLLKNLTVAENRVVLNCQDLTVSLPVLKICCILVVAVSDFL